MKHVLSIRTDHQPIALERLLQVARYRGFAIQRMEMTNLPGQRGQLVTLYLDTEKPIHLLTNQLNKMYHVDRLELVTQAMNEPMLATAGCA